jgi:DNA-binding response OmpR family regulator
MPRMHGLYLIEMIKAKKPKLPVILVSAYVDEKFNKLARKKGADDVLKKPFEYNELLASIQKVLKRKR